MTTMEPKDISADGQVHTGNGVLLGVVLTPAAAVATLVLYDGTDTGGQVLARLQAAANGESAILTGVRIPFQTGLYANIDGAGAAAVAYL